MIHWDSIQDYHIEVGKFENHEDDLYLAIGIKSLGIIFPCNVRYLKNNNANWQYYIKSYIYSMENTDFEGEEILLSSNEKNNNFFKTLKQRVFRLYPELLL